jgi:predicted nucleotidyltransferase
MFSLTQHAIDEGTKQSIQRFVDIVRTQYPISQVVLFGSRARSLDVHDSDADVMLLLRGEHHNFVGTKLALADAAFDVLVETGIRIDPLPVWEDQWTNPVSFTNPQLLANIEREGILIS